MQVYIVDTKKEDALEYIDSHSGTNSAQDLIGNQGALYGQLSDGYFEWDKINERFICDQETYDWWKNVFHKLTEIDKRVSDLIEKLPTKENEILTITQKASINDLEQYILEVNRQLDSFEEENNQ